MKYNRGILFVLLLAVGVALYGRDVRIKVPSAGWYRITADEMASWGITSPHEVVFYSDGLVRWNKMNDGNWVHKRNTCALSRYYIVRDDGTLSEDGDTVDDDYNFALHETETANLCETGQDFVGETFGLSDRQRTFTIATPGGTRGTAYLNVQVAHVSVASSSVEVLVNGVMQGSVPLAALTGSDCASSGVGRWKFAFDGESSVSVTINFKMSSGNGYLDWIEVVYPKDKSLSPQYRNVEYVGDAGASVPLTSADIVIVSDPEFIEEAERLGDLHEQYDGLSYVVVTQDMIFNTYSSSTPSTDAVRMYMNDMHALGAKYLVLFGDGCYDNRGLLSSTVNGHLNRLLTFQSPASFVEDAFCSDDYYCMGGSNITMDSMFMAVGRIPANTSTQAHDYVSKVEKYLRDDDLGEWKNRAIFLADDGDNNEHVRGADTLTNRMTERYPELLTRKLFFDSYKQVSTTSGENYPVLKKEFDDYINSGVLLVNFTGHGGYANLSNEQILSYTDMQTMKNKRLPFWITETCSFGRFDALKECGAEAMLFNPDGGSIGLISSCRSVYSYYNVLLGLHLEDYILAEGVTVGEALRRAKNVQARMHDSNRLPFLVIGDPVLKINYAQNHDVVCSSSVDTVGALDVVRLDGEVRGDDNFNGIVNIVAFDKKERVRTLSNDDPAVPPFEYYDRLTPIFNGKSEVHDGRFSVEFVIPKDIRYNYGYAHIVMYAYDVGRGVDANGVYDSLVIGGECKHEVNDTVGPELRMWLNTPEFVNNSVVGSDALFSALTYDEYGINTTGSGIGHDIMMWLDGDVVGTNLNNYYSSDMNSYRGGRVDYWLRGLSEGHHSLRFRCWDMVNNSSSGMLSFIVVNGYEGALIDVRVFPNPATEYANFHIVTSSGVETDNIKIDIFDISARKVWSCLYSDFVRDNDGNVLIPWNLTNNVEPGIYFARVTLVSSSGKYYNKTVKILVNKK
ncbi:MAG: type IX secretion system sortase PorU [Paludibacteraceae bacterium]|nr:type IX secretion system sortase PorU [Paludibacteraceae bacterium]